MILADTSVVIEFLRTADPKMGQIVVAHAAGICGATRAEVLNGAKGPAHRQRLLSELGLFHAVSFPEPLWDEVGDNLAALRLGGVTVPFPDIIIATVAIADDIELWTRDNQFKLIQQVLPALRLFEEPP